MEVPSPADVGAPLVGCPPCARPSLVFRAKGTHKGCPYVRGPSKGAPPVAASAPVIGVDFHCLTWDHLDALLKERVTARMA